MARPRNKPPVANRGATGKHATKTPEERQEYKDYVKSAPGAGETVEHPLPERQGISAPPVIQSPPVPVGIGDRERIEPPAAYAAPSAPAPNILSKLLGYLGIAFFLAIGAAIYEYARLEGRVDNNERTVRELGDKQDKARDLAGDIVERVAKLEVKVDNAVRSGASTVALAAEVASLRRALEAQDDQDGFLTRRIEAVEARLTSMSSEPSNP